MEYPVIHIGKIIREKVECKGWSQAKFAEKMNMKRQNVVKTIFEKSSLDSNILRNASMVLGVNLFTCFFNDHKEVREAGRDYVERGKIEHNGPEYAVSSETDLRDQIAQLKSQLADKERIIRLLERK